MASSQATTSTDERQLTREERVALLRTEMRRRNGQDQPSFSFPVNPRRDPNNPNDQDDIQRDRIGHTNWCTCTNCIAMPTGLESICCCEIDNVQTIMDDLPCILEHPMMYNLCQNPAYARIFQLITSGFIGLNPADRDTNRGYRKAVYRAFTAHVHGPLGRGNRRPIPACVVNTVRRAFPDPEGVYLGFKRYPDVAAEHMAMD